MPLGSLGSLREPGLGAIGLLMAAAGEVPDAE